MHKVFANLKGFKIFNFSSLGYPVIRSEEECTSGDGYHCFYRENGYQRGVGYYCGTTHGNGVGYDDEMRKQQEYIESNYSMFKKIVLTFEHDPS